MGYIIKRSDAKAVAGGRQWLLLYGRRKVGKTFMLKELCKFRNYYALRRDGAVMSPKGTITKSQMAENVKALLASGSTVVIDEFQRLDEGTLEEMAAMHPKGRLILSGSSLSTARKIFEPSSPLLGFFTPMHIGFISPSDMLLGLRKEWSGARLIELSTFIREPWIIPNYGGENVTEFVYRLVTQSRQIIAALVGEIFTEEERELSKKYQAILSLVGAGTWKTSELVSVLFSRGLIPSPSPTHVIQYIKNLERMGLLEGIKLHKSKGYYYRLVSPLMNIYYYLDSRYDMSERAVSLEEAGPTLQRLINLEIQNFVADLFAEIYGGRKEYFVSADREVDFIITSRNKAVMIGEVKWKKLERGDVLKFMRNSNGLGGRRVIVCKASSLANPGVEILDADGLITSVRPKIN